MKRRTVMAGFATAGIVLASLSLHAHWQYRQARQLANAVAGVPVQLSPDTLIRYRQNSPMSSAPAVQLAIANALLQAGHLDTAEPLLGALSGNTSPSTIAEAARFNLANAYLRQALATERSSGRHRSLIELAKQRYRELLADHPEHAPARYNLEMALRLSPEQESYDVDERGKPIKSVSVVFPGFEDRELP